MARNKITEIGVGARLHVADNAARVAPYRGFSMWRWCLAPFALLLMRQDGAKVAHIDPSTARRAFDEMLPLILRFTAEALADDGLGRFHRRFCRSNVVRALLCSTSARPTACSGVAP